MLIQTYSYFAALVAVASSLLKLLSKDLMDLNCYEKPRSKLQICFREFLKKKKKSSLYFINKIDKKYHVMKLKC